MECHTHNYSFFDIPAESNSLLQFCQNPFLNNGIWDWMHFADTYASRNLKRFGISHDVNAAAHEQMQHQVSAVKHIFTSPDFPIESNGYD